jgi:CMP-N-acetylneuraminic acid synthetase
VVTIAVIPARGGSKRIPRKNIVDFHGKPLVHWTVQAAVNSELIDEVIISTDDEEIEAAAITAGARSFGLRDRFCDDLAPSSLVSLYETQRFMEVVGVSVDSVVQLLPTCPLRSGKTIDTIVGAYLEEMNRPRLSAHSVVGGNVWWSAKLGSDGTPTYIHPEAIGSRSQDLPEIYLPNGAVWVISTHQLMEHQTFYAPGFVFHPIPWEAGFDIDNFEELELARALAFRLGDLH